MNNVMWIQPQIQHQQPQPLYTLYILPHGYINHVFEHAKDCPRSRPIGENGMAQALV